MTKELFISVDIETTGPAPGKHSMISIGCVACVEDNTQECGYKVLDTFNANLEEVSFDGLFSTRDTKTMKEFWEKHPEAWEIATANPQPPEDVIRALKKWLIDLPKDGRPIFVGYPVGFDFSFVYWYMHYFTNSCEFGYQPLDIKTYAYAALGGKYKDVKKATMPKHWFKETKLTHVALDDALNQAHLFFQIRKKIYENTLNKG
jgi:DNA polymerase III epsilon subunit-like protein